MKPCTRLVLPDVHIPFHDPCLVKAWLKHARDLKPSGVDIIGDLIDCYPLSRFDKNPLRKTNIQGEIDLAHEFLLELRHAVGDTCDIRYSEGNHENRLKRILWGRAKELAPLRNLDIPQLLSLRELGIRYFRPEAPYKIGRLWYLHGDLARKCNWSVSYGGAMASAVCKRIGASALMGHSHQMGHVCFNSWAGLAEGFEVGCLCRFDLEYLVGVPQWQQGWATVDYTPSGYYDVTFARVLAPSLDARRTIVFCGTELATIPKAKAHL